MNFLSEFFGGLEDEHTREFYNKYLVEVYKLLNFVSTYYKINANSRNKKLHDIINEIIPVEYNDLTLSQKTMLLIYSTPGVSTVLIGARKEKYVEDSAKILELQKLPETLSVFKKIKTEVTDYIN